MYGNGITAQSLFFLDESSHAFFAELFGASSLGIEMILTRRTPERLAVFGNFDSFGY